jgi:RNA polymerase sigma-70 factor (ECF subfamily)
MRSFERAVEAEISVLRRYARALARDSARADDLLQDCLERALSRRHLFVRADNLRGWLFRMMRNIHLNNLRAASRRPVTVNLDHAGAEGSWAGQIAHVEIVETLAAFDRLPEEYREVLALVAVEGLSYREAAQVIGHPIGTVMSRMARAREQLRALAQAAPGALLRRVK